MAEYGTADPCTEELNEGWLQRIRHENTEPATQKKNMNWATLTPIRVWLRPWTYRPWWTNPADLRPRTDPADLRPPRIPHMGRQ